MSEHPCHNLSNTDKQIFTCRHCMAKFYDPIQRWRHSKNCKKDAPSKSREGMSTNGKRDLPAEIAEKGGIAKKKQKKENPLSCFICKSSFNSLEEMKEHVRNPCSKPPVTKPQETVPANPELEHFEQQLQELQDAKGEDIATNQIESLLRAAQALHQQQQEQQRQQAEQLQRTHTLNEKCHDMLESQLVKDKSNLTKYYVETEVIPDGGNPDWLYNQGEPVLCSVEEYGEPRFPNYSSIEGSGGVQTVQVEQVSSTPIVEDDRSLHTPPIKLTTEGYSPLPPQEITVNQSEQDPHANNTQITFSGQQSISLITENINQPVPEEKSHKNEQGGLPEEKLLFSSVEFVGNSELQNSASQEFYNAAVIPHVIPSEVKLMGNDGVTVTVVLSPNTSAEPLQKTGSTGDEFDLISQVIGEDFTQHDSTEIRDLNDIQINSDVAKTDHCGSKHPSDFSSSNVSFVFQSEQSKKAITYGQDSVLNKADLLTKNEQVLSGDIKHDDKSKEMNMEQNVFFEDKDISNCPSVEKLARNNLEIVTLMNENKEENMNQKLNHKSQSSENAAEDLKNDLCGEMESKAHPVREVGAEKPVCPEIKTVKKKSKREKTPKCRVCDKEFKTVEQLRKHNKVPCKVRLTRNLTQKVLRPKRLEKVVPLQTVKKKKKQKVMPAKPKMITLINRRFTDKTLEFNKDKKGKLKTRRKSLYDYNFCITRSTDYRNANLDVLVQYDSLDEKEQHFFHLGLVATDHLPADYRTPKSLIKRVLKEKPSCVMEKVIEKEVEEFVEDEPPVLEKVVDAAGRIQEDIYILRDEIHRDMEPPVLITVEGFGTSSSMDEGSNLSKQIECPTLIIEPKENIIINDAILTKDEFENREPNKENDFDNEQLESISTPRKEQEDLSEELTVAENSHIKSPNKTLSERHFTDAMDVLSDTFSDGPKFTKTKLKDDDGTKPSYSVTLGLQTDIPSVTDKIMYPRSAFILKCLKRLENKHKIIQDCKPSMDRGKTGRKNLFESLENVSEDTKMGNISIHNEEKHMQSQTTKEEDNEQKKPIEEIVVYPKPIDPKNLEYRKPSLVIPSDEDILNYTDDSVIRKQPDLDSVSPENGRDLLQILAHTLGIFPPSKTKPQEPSLRETPKNYKETMKEDTAVEKNGMQIIVMNNSAETNEYTMGIDVINVPKSINDELKNAASEIGSSVVFEDDFSQNTNYPGDTALSENKKQLANQGSSSSSSKPDDISIPKEVYEFLEEYDTISPSTSKSNQSGQVTQHPNSNCHINFVSTPRGSASEVVDIHFNFCSKESQQPNPHMLSLSNVNYCNSSANVNSTNNIEYKIPTGSAVLNKDSLEQGFQTDATNSEVLPLYAIPVGIVSENDQTSHYPCPEDRTTLSTSLTHGQASYTTSTPLTSEVFHSISCLENTHPVSGLQNSKTLKTDNKDKSEMKFSLPKVADSVQDSEQLWSRILEEYKAERLQNEYNEQNKNTGKNPLLNPSEQQRMITALDTKDNKDLFISKPAIARSVSSSATSTNNSSSNQTLQCCDTSENVSFMSCSFSPTNSSNSLKMIFRKEKSPLKENTHIDENPSEWMCNSPKIRLKEQFHENSVAKTDPKSTLCSSVADENDGGVDGTSPYVIVDTGVEICRKAMGTEEQDEHIEDISDEEDWALEKEERSQGAVT